MRAREEGGTMYSSILLGTAKPLNEIMELSGDWFKRKKYGLYLKHIQAEQQSIIGWLLYSVQSMELARLQQALEQKLGFPIHARWQVVNTGHNKDLKQDDLIRAVHLRVDSHLQDEAQDALEEIYSSKASEFPLDYKMRLIPPKDRMQNPLNADAFEVLRLCQRNFISNMKMIQTWEIASLHTPSPNVPISLHMALMRIPSPNFPKTQMFHCADKPSVRAPCSLWVHPLDEQFARSLVAGLIPYLRHEMRKALPGNVPFSIDDNKFMARHLYRFFNEMAVKRSMRSDWSVA
jgi:hypothetical protein